MSITRIEARRRDRCEGGCAYCEIKDWATTVTIGHPPMNALDMPAREALERSQRNSMIEGKRLG